MARGHDEALTGAFNQYARGLLSHAYIKLHNRTMCDDLVQDTFLKIWSYLNQKKDISALQPFLYHVLNNLIIDEYRKYKVISLDALLDAGYSPYVDTSDKLLNEIDGRIAAKLIRRLPPRYRRVMHLRYIRNYTLNEIALITGKTKNTTSVQLHRGLIKLRLLFDQAR